MFSLQKEMKCVRVKWIATAQMVNWVKLTLGEERGIGKIETVCSYKILFNSCGEKLYIQFLKNLFQTNRYKKTEFVTLSAVLDINLKMKEIVSPELKIVKTSINL